MFQTRPEGVAVARSSDQHLQSKQSHNYRELFYPNPCWCCRWAAGAEHPEVAVKLTEVAMEHPEVEMEHTEVAMVPNPCQQSCLSLNQPVVCPSLCFMSWLVFLAELSVIKPIMNIDNPSHGMWATYQLSSSG